MATRKRSVDPFEGTTDNGTDTDLEPSVEADVGQNSDSRNLEYIRKGMGGRVNAPGYLRRLAQIIKATEMAVDEGGPSVEEEFSLEEIGTDKVIRSGLDWDSLKERAAEKISLLAIKDIFMEDIQTPEPNAKRFKSDGDAGGATFAQFEAFLKEKILQDVSKRNAFTEEGLEIRRKDVKRYLEAFKASFSAENDGMKNGFDSD
jgi:hypothetical protein